VIRAYPLNLLQIDFLCYFYRMKLFVKRQSTCSVFAVNLHYHIELCLSQFVSIIFSFKTHFNLRYFIEYFGCENSLSVRGLNIGPEEVF